MVGRKITQCEENQTNRFAPFNQLSLFAMFIIGANSANKGIANTFVRSRVDPDSLYSEQLETTAYFEIIMK